MSSLRAPGLGPIVGDTTDTTCRIWIRAKDPADSGANLDEDRRTVGLIGMVEKDCAKDKIGDAWYFRLPREFDRTGTFQLGVDVDFGYWKTDIKREKESKGSASARVAKAEPLKPDTSYRIRVGTLTLDDPWPNEQDVPDWKLRDRLPDINALKEELLKLEERERSGLSYFSRRKIRQAVVSRRLMPLSRHVVESQRGGSNFRADAKTFCAQE